MKCSVVSLRDRRPGREVGIRLKGRFCLSPRSAQTTGGATRTSLQRLVAWEEQASNLCCGSRPATAAPACTSSSPAQGAWLLSLPLRCQLFSPLDQPWMSTPCFLCRGKTRFLICLMRCSSNSAGHWRSQAKLLSIFVLLEIPMEKSGASTIEPWDQPSRDLGPC